MKPFLCHFDEEQMKYLKAKAKAEKHKIASVIRDLVEKDRKENERMMGNEGRPDIIDSENIY